MAAHCAHDAAVNYSVNELT